MWCLNDKYMYENLLRLSTMSWLSHKATVQRPAISIIRINVYSDRKAKICQTVSFMSLPSFCVLSDGGGECNATHPTSQILLCAANPKKASSNYWGAFICHSLMWSYRRILPLTVTKYNKVFSGNQHHKRGVHIQHFRFRLFRQECVSHHIRNNEFERMCKELLRLIVCNYYSNAWRD
jgi:hypothetical protein